MEALTDLQMRALEVIENHTREDAVTGAELAVLIELEPRSPDKPGADMRQVIHALRVKGFPICASGKGYWWPKDQAELQTYIDSLQARINEQEDALEGLQKGFEQLGGSPILRLKSEAHAGYYQIIDETGDTKVIDVSVGRLEEFLRLHPKARKL